MVHSRNLNTYTDVIAVLQAAREAGGAIYELPSRGKATMWRARAYYYRKLLTEAAIARSGGIPGFMPRTGWDDMILTQEGNKVAIRFGTPTGLLRGLDGAVLDPMAKLQKPEGEAEAIVQLEDASIMPVQEEDALTTEAEALARKMGLK